MSVKGDEGNKNIRGRDQARKWTRLETISSPTKGGPLEHGFPYRVGLSLRLLFGWSSHLSRSWGSGAGDGGKGLVASQDRKFPFPPGTFPPSILTAIVDRELAELQKAASAGSQHPRCLSHRPECPKEFKDGSLYHQHGLQLEECEIKL